MAFNSRKSEIRNRLAAGSGSGVAYTGLLTRKERPKLAAARNVVHTKIIRKIGMMNQKDSDKRTQGHRQDGPYAVKADALAAAAAGNNLGDDGSRGRAGRPENDSVQQPDDDQERQIDGGKIEGRCYNENQGAGQQNPLAADVFNESSHGQPAG